jgi:hypothetical protein
MDEDCTMNGSPEYVDDIPTSPEACQSGLAILGPGYGADYFIYDQIFTHCSYWKASNRGSCGGMIGPVEPDIETCGVRRGIEIQFPS